MPGARRTPPAPPDAYVIFPRMISPERSADLLNAINVLINEQTARICVSFSSVGGGVPAAFALYNNLRSLPVELRMHNIGEVSSAANVVFVAGAERTASPRATFNFHAPSVTLEAGAELDETLLVQHAKELAAGDARTREVLRDRTKMTAAKVDSLKRGQNSLGTNEARLLGLIDRVVDLKIPAGVPVVTI